eukprot:COSAG03_NODE_24607_length_271_cov_0.604651_1_plen_31_part_01
MGAASQGFDGPPVDPTSKHRPLIKLITEPDG